MGGLSGALAGAGAALNGYQSYIDNQSKIAAQRLKLQQEALELQTLTHQGQIDAMSSKLQFAAAMAANQPAPDPYSVNPPQGGGAPMMQPQGGIPGGLPGSTPMPQQGGAPAALSGPLPAGMMPQVQGYGAPNPLLGGQRSAIGGGMAPGVSQAAFMPGQAGPMGQQPQAPQQGQGGGGGGGGGYGIPPMPTLNGVIAAIAQHARESGIDPNNPDAQRAIVQSARSAMGPAMEQWKAQVAALKDQREGQYRQDELGERVRHDEADEGMSRGRLGLESARLGMEARNAGNKGFSFMVGGDGKLYRGNAGTGAVEAVDGAPQGLTRLGGPGQAQSQKSSLTDDAATLQAKIALATGKPPSSRNRADYDKITNRMGELAQAQGLDVGDVLSGQSRYKADTASLSQITRQTDAIQAFSETAKKNFDDALKLAPKAGLDFASPYLNSWVQTGKVQTGDPNVPAYVVKLVTAANEYAKVMSGATGSAAATEGARAEAMSLFKQGYSLPAITAAIDAAKTDMDNRISSQEGQIGAISRRLGRGQSQPTSSAPAANVIRYDAQGNRIP